MIAIIPFRKIAAIVTGSLLLAVGIDFFLVPLKIMDGGVIGIALILGYLFKAKVGLSMLLCSVPILLLAWGHNRSLVLNSLNGLLISTYLIDLLEPYQYHFLYYIEWTPFTRAVLGGFFIGTGLGVMLRHDCSTGGTDLLAHFIARELRMNVGLIVLLIDLLVIGCGALLIADDSFLLSLVTVTAGGVATSLCTLDRPAKA